MLSQMVSNRRSLIVFYLSCVAFLFPAHVAGIYKEDGPVVLIDSLSQFEREVIQATDAVWIVEFYSQQCDHCKSFAPEYVKTAKNLKGVVKLAAVDVEAVPEVAKAFQVRGYPLFKVFPHEKQFNPYTKKVAKVPLDYQGPLTGKRLAEFATNQIPSFVTAVASADGSAAEFVGASGSLPKAILFTNKDVTTPLYKALSLKYKDRLQLAEAKSSDEALCAQYGVTDFPALTLLPLEGAPIPFPDKISADGLVAFFDTHAAPAPEASAEHSPAAEEKPEKKVAVCTLETFNAHLNAEPMFVVSFVSTSEACAEEHAAATNMVLGLNGMVEACEMHLGEEDSAASQLAKTWGAEGVLQGEQCVALALFPFGGDKPDADAEVYDGEMAAKPFQAFVSESMPNFVAQFDMQGIQAFLAEEIMKPKLMLLSEKDEVPGTFKALAMNFQGEIMYAMVTAGTSVQEKEAMKSMGVFKLPAVVLASVSAPESSEESANFSIQPYPGKMSYKALARFVTEIHNMLGSARGQRGDGSTSGAGRAEPVEVAEITTNAEFEAACTGKGGLCVLAMLDSTHDAHESNVELFKTLAAQRAGQPLSISWVDAPRQAEFITHFQLQVTDAPTAVVFSPKKLRYASMRGAFSMESLDSLVQGVMTGKMSTSMMQDPPVLVDGGSEPQDNMDMEEIEDEFDLDDIMGETVSETLSKEDLLKQAEKELAEEKVAKKKAEEEAAAQAEEDSKKKRKKNKKGKKGSKKAAKDDL